MAIGIQFFEYNIYIDYLKLLIYNYISNYYRRFKLSNLN